MFFPEQEYKTSTKSEEELKKLTLEENLTECQRAYQILTKGQQLQKKAIYSNLHRILKEPHAFEILFKVIIEEVQQQEEENQIIAAKSLQKLIKEPQLQVSELLQIYDLTTQILKIWSLPVLNEWIHTMDALIRTLSLNLILNPLQQLILLLTDGSQPTISRQSAAKLIGTLAQLLGNGLKGPLLDRARNLCSDHDKEIRLVMAEDVIIKVCQSISSDLIECYLLEKIMELYYDTDIVVKSSGMKLFFTIAHQLSNEEIKNRCCKQFIDQIQSQSEESKIVMSKVCGRVLMLTKDFLSVNSLNLFFTIYNNYAKHKNSEVRINFLSNFPAILSLSGKKFEFFQDSYMLCCNDQNEGVQRCLVSSFHEVVLLSENTEILTHVFIGFMKGKNVAILDILVNRFTLICAHYMRSQQQPLFGPPALELLNQLLTKSQWDMQIELLTRFLECQSIFPDLTQFCNTMIHAITKGIPKTKSLCCQNMTQLLSSYSDLRRRRDWILKFFDIYFRSDSYFDRMTFIEIVQSFAIVLSRKLFKQYDFFEVLLYAKDPVLNVRMRLIKIFPILYKKIQPDDQDILNQFNEAVQHCIKGGTSSFQQIIQQTKEALLKPNDEDYLTERDTEMMEAEELVYKNDQKQRQLVLDQEREDLEINRIDFNDYLTKYKKKYPLTKIKITSTTMHSQTMLNKKSQVQNASSALLVKKSVDFDCNKSPLIEAQASLKKPVLKSKTPQTKSICDLKKQFKLPSIKK